MYTIKTNTSRVNKLIDRIGDLTPQLELALKNSVTSSALLANSRLQQNTPVDTGRLRSSVGINYSKGGFRADIGPDLAKAYYAPFVEFGHHLRNGKFLPGQFFIRRTANELGSQIRKIFRDSVKKAATLKK